MTDLFPSLVPGLWRALRCVGRGLKKLGRALLYIIPVLLVIHITATLITGRMLHKEIARLTAKGDLVPRAELLPAIPAGQKNAADIYQRAFDALRLSKQDDETLFAPSGLRPQEERSADWMALARRVVSANRDYLALLDQASRIPACAFPVKWDNPLEAAFPHFASMRNAARMLSLRAEVLAADGDLDGALASCAAALRMAEHAKLEPTLIGQLVAYAIQGIAVNGLEQVLSASDPSPAACRQLFDQVAAIDQIAPSVRAIHAEAALFGMPVFDMFRRGQVTLPQLREPGDQSGRGRRLLWRVLQTIARPLVNLDEVSYLRAMEQTFEAFRRPWPDSGRLAEQATAGLERLPGYRRIFSDMVMPVFARAASARDSRTASLRAAQIALALAAYHAEHARYPASLADLGAAGWNLPADPFGAKPFHYRREGNGFLLWSIGPDMDDDNAAKDYESFQKLRGLDQHKHPYDYDILFRCQR